MDEQSSLAQARKGGRQRVGIDTHREGKGNYLGTFAAPSGFDTGSLGNRGSQCLLYRF